MEFFKISTSFSSFYIYLRRISFQVYISCFVKQLFPYIYIQKYLSKKSKQFHFQNLKSRRYSPRIILLYFEKKTKLEIPELADLSSGIRPRFPALTVPGVWRTVAATTDRSYFRRLYGSFVQRVKKTKHNFFAVQKMI